MLAAEDRTFRSNPGFDITAIGRAVISQLTGGDGGGSTITQQYVKNTTGQDQATPWRRYREAVIAAEISKRETKDQILEDYLDTICLGRGAYGIETASKAYFGKDVGDLTVSEGAMLAGLIRSPAGGDPAVDLVQAKARWNNVLDGMVQTGWLTPADRAAQVFPDDWLRTAPAEHGIPDDERFHIYTEAKSELAAAGITQDRIDTLGPTVTTTVDPGTQEQAVAAVTAVMDDQPADCPPRPAHRREGGRGRRPRPAVHRGVGRHGRVGPRPDGLGLARLRAHPGRRGVAGVHERRPP